MSAANRGIEAVATILTSASTFQSSSPDGKRSGEAASGGEATSSAAGLEVRQLPASAEYLPTDEQTADIAFLAMAATGASRNDELIAALDAGQYINVADIRGNTIMHLILERGEGQEDFVKLMRSKGAAIDFANEKGKTPLMIAIAFQRHELIAYLVENGADLQALDNSKMSMLHIASWFGHLEVIEYLISQKARSPRQCSVSSRRERDRRVHLLLLNYHVLTMYCEGESRTPGVSRHRRPYAPARLTLTPTLT